MSEDISYRQRRYLISMGVRVVAFLLAVFLFHGVWRFIAAAIALVVPYFAVVFANGGREPDNSARFEPFEPNLPQRAGAHDAAAVADAAARKADAAGSVSRDGAGGTDGTRDDTSADDSAADDSAADDSGTDDAAADDAAADDAAADDAAADDGAPEGVPSNGHPGRPEGNREGEAFLSRRQADTRS